MTEIKNLNILIGRENVDKYIVDKYIFDVFLDGYDDIVVYDTSVAYGLIHSRIVGYINDRLQEGIERFFDSIPSFLYRLYVNHPTELERIVKTIRLVDPYFDRFSFALYSENGFDILIVQVIEKNKIIPSSLSSLSSGMTHFICLATLLLQPQELKPHIIVIKEPEIGLHPYTLEILAGLIKTASTKNKVIISTQSPTLLNHFSIDDLVVAERTDVGTSFKRLNEDDYKAWLEDYSLGDLWQKNVIGGN